MEFDFRTNSEFVHSEFSDQLTTPFPVPPLPQIKAVERIHLANSVTALIWGSGGFVRKIKFHDCK